MNLTAPVNLLALLLAGNNQSSNHKPDDGLVEQYGWIRCYDCGEYVTNNTWCNDPTEQNAHQDGIKNCYPDLCVEAVYTYKSNLETVIERRCGIEGLCPALEMKNEIRVERCLTCGGHFCNEGAKLYQSSWLLTTIISTTIAKLSISIFMSK